MELSADESEVIDDWFAPHPIEIEVVDADTNVVERVRDPAMKEKIRSAITVKRL